MGKLLAQTKKGIRSSDRALDWEEALAGQAISIYHETLDVLKKGIISGAANVPLSLQCMQTFVDMLHGGSYRIASNRTPFHSPAIQAQLSWVSNPIAGLGFFLNSASYIDLNATVTFLTPGLPPIVQHPSPDWIALPAGAKPEQVEAIINSGVPHVLPKVISDAQYFLVKEWDSLFFSLNLATGISTQVRALVQTGADVTEGRGGGDKEAKRLLEAMEAQVADVENSVT